MKENVMEAIDKLKWITQAIAQPYEVQIQLFPEYVLVADELALEWESAIYACQPYLAQQLTEQQKAAIKTLDDYMLSISGPENLQFWEDEGLRDSAEWNEMRRMAADILESMGWANKVPDNREDLIYVTGD